MSFNQSKSDSRGGGVKGGSSTAPPPPSSINSSSNRRYKNSGSGQPRVNATSLFLESNVAVACAVRNGVTAKPASSSIPRSPQPIPRPPSKQAAKSGAPRKVVKITHLETQKELRIDKRIDLYSDGSRSHPNVTPQSQPSKQAAKFGAPRKVVKITHLETHKELRIDKRIDLYSDGSRSDPNIRGRTTSAPPNLDEQKRGLQGSSNSGSKDKVKSSNAKARKKNGKDILKAKQDVVFSLEMTLRSKLRLSQ